MARNNDGRNLYSSPAILRVVVNSPKIPVPYKALLVVHAYIAPKYVGGRKALVEARLDDVEVDADAGVVYVLGAVIAEYAALYLAEYLEGWRATYDSEWLFPHVRGRRAGINDMDKHINAVTAGRYITRIGRGEITLEND